LTICSAIDFIAWWPLFPYQLTADIALREGCHMKI